MERAYSHSRPPAFSSKKKPPPFSSSSSSSSFHNNGGFFTTSYDDVFGGPPKFASSSSLAPRAEDYSEIFGGFRLSSSSSSRSSSSIPVLDLPAVPDDIHSAAAFFDYSEVFGGFNAVDFAVPFDELFRPCDDSFYDDDGDAGGSSDEAWTPAGSDSLSDDSDPFAFTEEKSELSTGTSHQQSESKQFNVSYHKINPGTSTYMPNTMHVTQLNDVPGYTCVVDEAIGRDICSPVVDDIVLSVGSPSHITQKHTTKCMSHASYDDIGSKSCDSDRRSGKSCSARTSHTSSTFASVSDINLRTEPSHLPPPSRPPPVLADRSEDINELISGPLASEKCGVEATIDGSLPPVFDMEVDASSSAAVSAAAMKDAMEKAQAILKAAKDQRQRKERIQNSEKQHIETDKNCGKNTQVVCDESFTIEARVPTTSDGGPSKMKIYAKAGHAKNASQNLPDILAAEQFTGVSEKPAGTKQVKKSSLSMDTVFTDADCQWKEARQYYEFVNSDNTWLEPQLHSSNGDAKTIIKQQGDDGHNSDSAGEACVTVENRRRLKATKVISRQEYYEKMVKVAQEVHDSVTCGHVEPEKRLNDKSPGNLKQQKPESIYEPKKPEIPLCESHKMENPSASVWKEEAGKRSKKVPTKEENKEESEYSGLCDINAVGLHGSMVKEAFIIKQELRKSSESERFKGDYQVQETVETEGHEQKAEEFCEKPRTESTVAVSPKQKRNKDTKEVVDKRSKGSSKEVLSGDSMQSARESEEKEKMKDLKRMKAADKRLKEAFVDVSSRNEMLPCEKQENNKRTTLQQREEVEIHLTEAVHGKESKKMLEKCTEMEKSQKNKEVPKEAIGSQRLYGVHNLIVDDKCSEEGQKQYNKTVKLEKTTDLEHKSLQACKLEKVYCKLEEAAQEQRFKTKLEKCVTLENCENNIEVPKQATRLQKLDEARNMIVENSNSEEIQKQDSSKERLEMATEPKHKPLQTCDLKKTRKSDENTDDKEDQNGAYKHHVKIQQDEDQGPTSFPDIELPIEDNNLKSSKWTNLHKDAELDLFCKLEKADDFNELTAQKDIGDIGSTLSDEISNLETVKTADVLIDEKQTEPDVTQVSHKDSELDARTFRASDTLAPDEDNITTGGACSRNEQNLKEEKRKVAQSTPDPSMVKNFNNEVGGKRNLMGEGPVLFEHEEKVRYTQGINGVTEHVSREEVTHTVQPEGKASFQKTSHPPNFGPSIERKGRIDHNCLSEEKDGDRERDLEKERLQKLEEERERLREREKDRMAVEIAVREARDRAYADARDRAERAALERATDDARQRAMAEARERLEKACAEARERSLADKAEARLKAERAAVERATAEARQRAIEKAMADRTTFDARDRMQRSVSEKYLSEREVMMRQSSFPMSSERFEAANIEPAQRCKARLERHRRTVERVAKALAEKNMRDLLAQREQAERTRLAETLDADIRRWSSGKEGNLRALLSTLQYILGPDSGWHPIPLTEVITAAAVKKAYRKATLCVHPDKLQQRGASVQQKYICEKVFDLLKEAWNRFNSEEK